MRQRAAAMEQTGDLRLALAWWEMAGAVDPADPEAAARAAAVRARLDAEAQRRFEEGRRLFARGARRAARKEFVMALYNRPDHAGALEYLYDRMAVRDWDRVVVGQGETLDRVAKRHYGDNGKAYILSAANNLPPGAAVPPGTVLRAPKLTGIATAKPPPEKDYSSEAAQAHLEKGQYDKALAEAQRVLDHDPTNAEAGRIKNIALYQKSARLKAEGKYDEALEALRGIDSGYGVVERAVEEIRALMRAMGE
ncbi:MAG: hypothetical protein ACLFOY_07370 [Desulfatibacillaceae bacterium]